MRIYQASETNPALIKKQKIAIIGYGNQGAAHAENLRDSSAEVIIGARENSQKAEAARAKKFTVLSAVGAARAADIVMIMTPDETHQAVYQEISAELTPQKILGFCHGLAVHFGYIQPPPDLDVMLVSPKVPGYVLRENYQSGKGSLILAGIWQNPSGRAMDMALSYATAISGGDAGILESTFGDECITNLFGEQAVLCGGIPEVIKAAYDTLVEAGYPEELAYSECVNQSKLLVDLIVKGGIKFMREKISNTAEYGGLVSGPRVINDGVRAEMKEILTEIRSGAFAQTWMDENKNGLKNLQQLRQAESRHGTEKTGQQMRSLMQGSAEERKAS